MVQHALHLTMSSGTHHKDVGRGIRGVHTCLETEPALLCRLHAGVSPETDDQAEFVREFERALEDGGITRTS